MYPSGSLDAYRTPLCHPERSEGLLLFIKTTPLKQPFLRLATPWGKGTVASLRITLLVCLSYPCYRAIRGQKAPGGRCVPPFPQ